MFSQGTRTAGSRVFRAQVPCMARAAVGRVMHPVAATTRRTAVRHTIQPVYRPFSVSAPRPKDGGETGQAKSAVATEAEAEAETEKETEKETETADDVPWYLKEDVPKHETLTPQTTPLPPIPAHSPAILEPLVTFAADDLGLDDLQIMDLRLLDPPSALGPDLMMVFSTARSERHLHVSADRLVRWFRQHGVRADADGLLGRNELKIKLRRKARKAKLLSHMGQLAVGADGEVDDGISTKWVCVHGGVLGGGSGQGNRRVDGVADAVVDEDGRVSGFGSVRSVGTTIVVQLFTEAKRKQMALEAMWTETLWHSLRKRSSAGEDVEEQLLVMNAAMDRLRNNADETEAAQDWFASLPTADDDDASYLVKDVPPLKSDDEFVSLADLGTAKDSKSW